MSVDFASAVAIGCSVKNFDDDRRTKFYNKGLNWYRGGSCYSGDMDDYVVGLKKYVFCTEIGNQCLHLTKEELIAVYDETKQALEAVGLWDESTFGLWAIGMES